MLFNTGPQVDLDTAFTRCMALISAAFIAAIVHILLWPNNPLNLLKQKISKAIVVSGQILSNLLIVDIKQKETIEAVQKNLEVTREGLAIMTKQNQLSIGSSQINQVESFHQTLLIQVDEGIVEH